MSVNLKTQLTQHLPPAHWQVIQAISQLATRPVYLIGGLVRDLLLQRPSLDLDIVVEGDAISFARQLQAHFGGQIQTHKPFGTATWQPPNLDIDSLDFVTARSETYPRPGALPLITPSTLTDDLARRDFTINTLAIRLDGTHFGQLIDPHNAQADLTAKRIRILHKASFLDDPTRIFRAVRYEQRLGFALEPTTLALLQAGLDGLANLTPARVRHEFERIWAEPRPEPILTRLHQLAILPAIHPALAWQPATATPFARLRQLARTIWATAVPEPTLAPLYWAIWLSDLAPADQAALADRLRLRRVTQERIGAVARLLTALAALPAGSPPSTITKTIRPFATRPGTLLATRALQENGHWLDTYWHTWQHITPTLTGHDLRRQGLQPGPRFAHILDQLRFAYLDGLIHDPAGELTLLDTLIQNAPADERPKTEDEKPRPSSVLRPPSP